MCSLSETFFYIAVLIEIIVDWYALVRNNRGISCSPYLVSLNGNVLQNSSINSVQFSRSVVSDSLNHMNHSLDPMNDSTPGLPVHHQLPEFTQTHVHWVGDTIQPSHPLSSPSPALNLSQHQCLFKWVSFSHQVAKLLEFQLQQQSCQWTPRTDLL